MQINSNAPIISRHEITISAPLETVWRVLTQIDSWSDWNPDMRRPTSQDRLRSGNG